MHREIVPHDESGRYGIRDFAGEVIKMIFYK